MRSTRQSLYDTSSSLDEPVPPETLVSSPTLVGDTLTPRLASGFAVYDGRFNRLFQSNQLLPRGQRDPAHRILQRHQREASWRRRRPLPSSH